MQNAMLILSQDRPEKNAQESLLLMTTLSLSTSLSLALSFYRSALLVSRALSFSQFLFVTQLH